MEILISPNAFKNSLTATQAAEAIKIGLEKSKLQCNCRVFPIADGGDGTARLITELCQGQFVEASVHDPLERKINAKFGIINNGETAVIDVASASGIELLKEDELQPLRVNTYGTGELIKLALEKGVKKILIGVGGSATVDAGAGILQALGFQFLNEKGEIIKAIPENMLQIASIDTSRLDKRIKGCEVKVLCDVKNPLLGSKGAAPVFGPQKGASEKEVKFLEMALAHFNRIIIQETGRDMADVIHGGAAGGVAASLMAFFNASLVNGIDHFLAVTGFDEKLKTADLLITGGGSLDKQTLEGKGPFGVAVRAKKHNIPVIGLAGKIPSDAFPVLQDYFDALFSINSDNTTLEDALKNTAKNLELSAREIGNLLSLNPFKK